MSIVFFRFYEELNDFLPSRKKKITFEYPFSRNQSVKDAVEALGVPHVEVDMILVNGNPVDFTYKLKNEDQISVYPVFETLDISKVSPLRKKPLRDPKFILDVHLGRLAKYMRLCGLDTLYYKHLADPEIVKISVKEYRIIITRDRNLLKNKAVTHGYWIRSLLPAEQFKEVLQRFDLKRIIKPFTRCLECNGVLTDVKKEDIIDHLLPKTKEYYSEFKKCPVCGRIYWEGSHFQRMKGFFDEITTTL
jgi:uncharacterized protein with PIN domain